MKCLIAHLWSRLWLTLSLVLLAGLAAHAQDPGPPEDIPEGYRIIEGDIQVPLDFDAPGMPWATNFWPNGIVPFEFHPNVTAANRQAMLAAMAEWTAVANVTFRPRTSEAAHVFIQNSTANNSAVGQQGGRQVIYIVSWGSRFVMAHELAHALGFWHEQSRPDRDAYIIINWSRIQPGQEHNFNRHGDAGAYGPYDFDSVMHYGQFAFSRDGQPTITVRAPWGATWQSRIGQRGHLSTMDRMIMSFIYPRVNWRFVNISYQGTQQGTFRQPYRFFGTGVANTPTGGTLWVQPGSYAAVGTYNWAMTLQAPLGGVTLGN